MQDFCQLAILDFISAKFVMGYPCVRHYILLYIHGPVFLLCFTGTVEPAMSRQPPMGGHLVIPGNYILYTNEPPMYGQPPASKGHFSGLCLKGGC